jgi:hypothetical protein
MIFYEVLLKQEGIIIEAIDVEDFKQKLEKIKVADICYEPQRISQVQFEAELKKRLVYLKKP